MLGKSSHCCSWPSVLKTLVELFNVNYHPLLLKCSPYKSRRYCSWRSTLRRDSLCTLSDQIVVSFEVYFEGRVFGVWFGGSLAIATTNWPNRSWGGG